MDGKISTEKIREKYQIDTSANGVISDVWGAQTRSIDLPFYHTKTYFTFNKIKNHNSFTNMQFEIVEDGN